MRGWGTIGVLGSVGCSGGEEGFAWPEATADAVATTAAIADASYGDAAAGVEALRASVGALVAEPGAGTLADARQVWRDSREPYLQTEVFRFWDGPIDDPVDGPEGLINAWPLDEQYVDYVEGDPDAGRVNGTGPIDGPTLEAANEAGGEKNIATGYHAVEFLLWGQDRSATGPGDRPFTDYVTDGSGTAANQDRRGQYLLVASDLLVGHLGGVREEWREGADFRAEFEAEPERSFERLLTGLIVLSGFETGGERLQASLDSGDQEDEHSCFSDNTHRDMVQDVRGIRNVWTGAYVAVDGATVSGVAVREVVAEVDPDLAAALDERIDESLALAEALRAPYDQEIAPGSDGNARVQALVTSLREQEGLLFEVFDRFGLSVTIPE